MQRNNHLRRSARSTFEEEQEFYGEESGLNMDLNLQGVMQQPATDVPPIGILLRTACLELAQGLEVSICRVYTI